MAGKTGVIIARVAVCVIVLALIGVAIYFIFFFGKTGASNEAYENLNRVLTSADQKEFEGNIGSLEDGAYYEFAQTSSNVDFESVYLNYSMDSLILSSYKDMMVYLNLNATDTSRLNSINGNIAEYERLLGILLQSQRMFNDTYEEFGATSAVNENFTTMVRDFVNLENTFRKITNDVFRYVTDNYYHNVNGFLSQKYAQTYALNVQSSVLNGKLATQVNTPLYEDSKAMMVFYATCSNSNFTEQSTQSSMADFVETVANVNLYDFNDFYSAENKNEYYTAQSGNENFQQALAIVANGLGLTQRIGG